MILRRLATSIRKQDWFTVAIETLIVVFGVFIGVQLGNWNEARQQDIRAGQVMEQLAFELSEIEEQGDEYVQQYTSRVQSLQRLLEFFLSDEAEPEDFGQFEADLNAVATVSAPIPRAPTLVELLSSGETQLIWDTELRRDIIRFDQQMQIAMQASDKINDVWVDYGLRFTKYAIPFVETDEEGRRTGAFRRIYDLEEMRTSQDVVPIISVMQSMNGAEVILREGLRDEAARLSNRLEAELP